MIARLSLQIKDSNQSCEEFDRKHFVVGSFTQPENVMLLEDFHRDSLTSFPITKPCCYSMVKCIVHAFDVWEMVLNTSMKKGFVDVSE